MMAEFDITGPDCEGCTLGMLFVLSSDRTSSYLGGGPSYIGGASETEKQMRAYVIF